MNIPGIRIVVILTLLLSYKSFANTEDLYFSTRNLAKGRILFSDDFSLSNNIINSPINLDDNNKKFEANINIDTNQDTLRIYKDKIDSSNVDSIFKYKGYLNYNNDISLSYKNIGFNYLEKIYGTSEINDPVFPEGHANLSYIKKYSIGYGVKKGILSYGIGSSFTRKEIRKYNADILSIKSEVLEEKELEEYYSGNISIGFNYLKNNIIIFIIDSNKSAFFANRIEITKKIKMYLELHGIEDNKMKSSYILGSDILIGSAVFSFGVRDDLPSLGLSTNNKNFNFSIAAFKEDYGKSIKQIRDSYSTTISIAY